MPKFIRLTKLSCDRSIAINVEHIVSFQTRETIRSPEQKGCLVLLVNDRIEVVETFDEVEDHLKQYFTEVARAMEKQKEYCYP